MNSNSTVDKLADKRKKVIEENQQEYESLREAFKNVFSNSNGIIVAKFIKKISLYDEMPGDFVDTSHGGMAYEKGRRHIWLILRKLMPKGILTKIEIE